MFSFNQEGDEDDDDASDMNPDTDRVHDRNELDQEGVDETMDNEKQEVDQEHLPPFIDPIVGQRDD